MSSKPAPPSSPAPKPSAARTLAVVAAVLGVGVVLFFIVTKLVGARETHAPKSPDELISIRWASARKSPMHTAHVSKKKIKCRECHVGGAGEDDPDDPSRLAARDGGAEGGVDASTLSVVVDAGSPRESCGNCHEREMATNHRGTSKSEPSLVGTECLDCHVFRGGETAPRCVDCHGKAGAPTTLANKAPARKLQHHQKEDLACGTCHDLHDKDRKKLPGDCATSGCHDAITANHGVLVAGESSNDPSHLSAACASCHAPHQGKEAARAACSRCHEASTKAASASLTSQNGVVAAWLTSSPLVTGTAPRIAHVTSRHDSGDACVTCHDPHDARRAVVKSCDGCHANKLGVRDIRGHAGACTTCHSPHSPRDAKTACARCHGGVTTIGMEKTAAHQECTSCHNPHEPAASPPQQACAKCHGAVVAKHPSGTKGACVGCHAPHRAGTKHSSTLASTTAMSTRNIASSCTSCHKPKTGRSDERAYHAVAKTLCTDCHKPHTFALHEKGAPQAGATAASSALCATCHADKASAAARPPNGGHAACGGCHGSDAAHAPKVKPSCNGCHAAESGSAHAGHATCTSCHDPHAGSLVPEAVTCTGRCHQNKVNALHARVVSGPQLANLPASAAKLGAKTVACNSCHRPHGPTSTPDPPSCLSSGCHVRASLPGLHSVNAHIDGRAPDKACATCHHAHSAPKADRATCTSNGCHADRATHQPSATSCRGCHFFAAK